MKMLIKDINIKSLVSGDKSARVTLETLYPEDIQAVASLAEKTEIEVSFDLPPKSGKIKTADK